MSNHRSRYCHQCGGWARAGNGCPHERRWFGGKSQLQVDLLGLGICVFTLLALFLLFIAYGDQL